jgi:hypothetical protein
LKDKNSKEKGYKDKKSKKGKSKSSRDKREKPNKKCVFRKKEKKDRNENERLRLIEKRNNSSKMQKSRRYSLKNQVELTMEILTIS